LGEPCPVGAGGFIRLHTPARARLRLRLTGSDEVSEKNRTRASGGPCAGIGCERNGHEGGAGLDSLRWADCIRNPHCCPPLSRIGTPCFASMETSQGTCRRIAAADAAEMIFRNV
jgi:hypothetical protein